MDERTDDVDVLHSGGIAAFWDIRLAALPL